MVQPSLVIPSLSLSFQRLRESRKRTCSHDGLGRDEADKGGEEHPVSELERDRASDEKDE
jgi:hypothetical protein